MTLKRLSVFGRCAAAIVAAAVFCWLAARPASLPGQASFGALLVLFALGASRLRNRYGAVLVCAITALGSTRYLIWRFSGAAQFTSPWEWTLGGGLLLAEAYTWVVMALSFLQSARPLRRPVALLGMVSESTPRVDVYIPTYNEPLSVVGPTVIAALAMDYPKDRFRVYLLDDGARPEFADFARRIGCAYLARDENTHAKAGNLNAAMKVTDGALICILDCDHVPTRAFLQLTVGWFEKDPRLALVQTPHHFYSPDPIQRNVKGADDMPAEGDLFYDTIQSGNDLWNATFFCGSCAVIRRAALEEVGGFAYETVTEDAHTALKIQRRGWNTAFLNIRLSAGLATETLGQHIAQRARWCRGMTQILRIDNPLFGPGLTAPQRLCYLNALLYYQFPLPRIAFLVSPLAYLFFGLNLMHAPAGVVFVYAAPHLILSIVANQRLQGKQRRAFWGEIYETVLAFHLVRPALLTLFSPAAGKFKVTDKGLRLERGYFDRHLVTPHLITAGLLAAGVAVAALRLLWPATFHESLGSFLLNTAWANFNVVILLSAIAVAREGRQVRQHVRRAARMPVTLYFADGRVVDATTLNISMGGLAVELPPGFDATGREVTDVDLQVAGGRAAFPVHGVGAPPGELRVQFVEVSDARERRLIEALMARADCWQPEAGRQTRAPVVRVLRSVVDISASTLRFIVGSGWRACRGRWRGAGVASLALAAVIAGHPAGRAAAAEAAPATRERRLALSPPCRGTAQAHLALTAQEVVLAARMELTAPLPSGEVRVNGEPAGRAATTGRSNLEPAVFLPGDNQITLSGACRAQTDRAPARLVLTIASLAPRGAPARRDDTRPAAPSARARRLRPPGASAAGLAAPGVWWWRRAQGALGPALAALAACALLAREAATALERQARLRLDGLTEARP